MPKFGKRGIWKLRPNFAFDINVICLRPTKKYGRTFGVPEQKKFGRCQGGQLAIVSLLVEVITKSRPAVRISVDQKGEAIRLKLQGPKGRQDRCFAPIG